MHVHCMFLFLKACPLCGSAFCLVGIGVPDKALGWFPVGDIKISFHVMKTIVPPYEIDSHTHTILDVMCTICIESFKSVFTGFYCCLCFLST